MNEWPLDSDVELLTAWNALNCAAHRLRYISVQALSSGLEELEQARKEFSALIEARLPAPPEEKHPLHSNDYDDAPDWATCILEGVPSDGIYVYARLDEEGRGYRGTPHNRATANAFFSIVGVDDDGEGCGWQVVSTRSKPWPPVL